ncbi:MAG: ectonucleotide pyrophosphatase/phosphodiesterase [Rubricoccaceae bacterium]
MRSFLCLALAVLAGCASPPPIASSSDLPVVVLVSIDGFRADYLDRSDVEAPTLRQLAAEGTRAERMVPVYPTKTFPNHYSLVTGLNPAQHGIVGNTMFDPSILDDEGQPIRFSLGNRDAVTDARWWGGEPIWVTAERQGLRTGTVFWPGSEAAIGGVRPSHWLVFDGGMPYAARVDTALAWLDVPERPRLLTLYFQHVDDMGHRHGPDAPDVDAAIEEVDDALARFLNGLRQRGLDADLVITSDHGMTAVSTERRIVLDERMDLDAEAESVIWGEAAGIYPAEGVDADALVTRLDAHPHMSAYARDATPARFRYRDNPRIPPVVLIPDEGWTVTSQGYVDRYPERPSGGAHGYDNQLESMQAFFLASGPSIRAGETIPELSALDVYGLLAQLLDVTPAPNEGDPSVAERVLR